MASGVKVARVQFRLKHGTWEPVVLMLREKFKWSSHENVSTDARHRGGTIRSSEEVSVMEMERRGCVTHVLFKRSTENFRRSQ